MDFCFLAGYFWGERAQNTLSGLRAWGAPRISYIPAGRGAGAAAPFAARGCGADPGALFASGDAKGMRADLPSTAAGLRCQRSPRPEQRELPMFPLPSENPKPCVCICVLVCLYAYGYLYLCVCISPCSPRVFGCA